jgi:hypothetical protein
MNRHFILFALAFAAALSGFAKTFDVDISTGRPAASNEAYYHGETIEFRAVRGRSVVTNVEYSCVYYQTNGMDSVWWHTDGLVFHPTNDVGAASYRFFLEGRDEVGRDWHANGLLRLLPSPGFTPNEIELPVARLDFANIEVANAPYYDKTETEAKIVELAPAPDYSTNNTELVETIHQTEVDPTVPAWAKKTVGDFYSNDLYSLVNRDFYANDSSINSQYSIWLKGSSNPTVTVGRDKLSDNTFPYARQTVRGFSAYEGFDYYAHYRPRGIYIWPWWNEDAEDNIAYLFPTNGNGGTFALTSDIDGKQDKLPYPTNAIPYAAISGTPNLATVATSGSYNDLSNKPTIPTAVSNIVTAAYINDRVNVTPLAGRTYNFATNIGLYTAVRDIIQALGGSVTNFPAIPQN